MLYCSFINKRCWMKSCEWKSTHNDNRKSSALSRLIPQINRSPNIFRAQQSNKFRESRIIASPLDLLQHVPSRNCSSNIMGSFFDCSRAPFVLRFSFVLSTSISQGSVVWCAIILQVSSTTVHKVVSKLLENSMSSFSALRIRKYWIEEIQRSFERVDFPYVRGWTSLNSEKNSCFSLIRDIQIKNQMNFFLSLPTRVRMSSNWLATNFHWYLFCFDST